MGIGNQSQCSCNALNIYTATCFFKQVCFPQAYTPSPKIQVFYQQQNKINKQNLGTMSWKLNLSSEAPRHAFFLHWAWTITLGELYHFWISCEEETSQSHITKKKSSLLYKNPWVLGYSGLPNIKLYPPYSASAPEGLIIWPFHRLFFRFISVKAQA